ncbi:aldehyde dehydrogenase family protein [Photobacterium frigidiphilum]|uniref:aldehyde dehydrogenase family protein n=1 Tax=Photobacterium frigidiphilum TaxID=264736 RepID=UPI003D10E2D3
MPDTNSVNAEINVISPINNDIYITRPFASPTHITASLKKAKLAQKQWQATPLAERKILCSKAIDWLVSNKHQLAEEITWMMGRPIQYSLGEIAGLEERARHMIAISDDALATIELPEKPHFTRYIKRVPLGTVFVIAPWNYPYLTAINSIIPALLSGNSVVLKHSVQTPLCAERLFQAFKEAGFPEGVFQYLHLTHQDTEHVISSGYINHVAFTGSVKGGKAIEQFAAGQLISVGLELGGKDPAYVCSDANLQDAVDTIIDGAFFNSGQSCCSIERVYVHSSIYDAFIEKAVLLINQYQLGRPDNLNTTLGPLVNGKAADFVREQTQEAIQQGAKPHIDEHHFTNSQAGSAYLAPQLLTNVNHTMRIMAEETFGPTLGIQKVESDQEAIILMNDSDFGLSACIFTQDIDKGIHLGDQLETGTFFINRCDYLDPALAWAGIKQSGRGCTLSSIGFEQLTRPKSYHVKHLI